MSNWYKNCRNCPHMETITPNNDPLGHYNVAKYCNKNGTQKRIIPHVHCEYCTVNDISALVPSEYRLE